MQFANLSQSRILTFSTLTSLTWDSSGVSKHRRRMAHLLSWAQGIVPNPRSPGVHHDNVHCQGSFKSVPTWAGRATVLYQPKSGDSCSNSLLRNSRAIRFSATSRPDSQGRTDATSVEPVETTEGRVRIF